MKKIAQLLCVSLILNSQFSILNTLQAQDIATSKTAPTAETIGDLPSQLEGSSSLFFLDGKLWSCNDHNTLVLYALDTLTAAITDSIVFDTTVYDLEEVTQDDEYLYLGDIGDNLGVRDDLHILRIRKTDLATAEGEIPASIVCDTIWFSYPDRTPDSARNFDCEAFVATDTALLLFTKQWLSQGSTCYSIPKTPGRWEARRLFFLPARGLVTGACHQPERSRLVLCGYNILCAPFVYIIDPFDGTGSDQSRHLHVDLSNGIGWQTEGIATADGLHYFLTSEHLDLYGIDHPAQLFTLDLTEFLDSNLTSINNSQLSTLNSQLLIYPNPAANRIHLPEQVRNVEVIDLQGRAQLHAGSGEWLDLTPLSPATYLIRITFANGQSTALPFVKQ